VNDPRRQLPAKLIDELDGLDWSVTNGAKHLKLFVRGRLIRVYSRSFVSDHTRAHKLLATVRRYRKGLAQ
jgi:hypothetical protein